jgi:hypothetical protein
MRINSRHLILRNENRPISQLSFLQFMHCFLDTLDIQRKGLDNRFDPVECSKLQHLVVDIPSWGMTYLYSHKIKQMNSLPATSTP